MPLLTDRLPGEIVEADDVNEIAQQVNTNEARIDTLESQSGTSGSSNLLVVSGAVTLDNSKPAGTLVGYRVTASTTFTGQGGSVTLAAGAYIFERVSGGWEYRTLVEGTGLTPPAPDTTPPNAGTLTVTGVTDTSATLTVSGASDNQTLHASPYDFSTDNGTTWTSYQASNVYVASGLTPETSYTFRHRVRDASGNVTQGTAITQATLAEPPLTFNTTDLLDTFTRADGSIGNTVPMDSGQLWGGSYISTTIVSGRLSPALGAGAITAQHGVATGTLQGSIDFHAPASTAVEFRVAFKSVAGTKGDGWGIWVGRQATRDLVQFEGTGITCTFNNGNGSLGSNPWAFLPGHNYATAQTYEIRCVMTDTKISIYSGATLILEGNYTAPASAPWLYLYGTNLSSVGYLDNVKVMTP